MTTKRFLGKTLDGDIKFLHGEAESWLTNHSDVDPKVIVTNLLLAQKYLVEVVREILNVQTDIPEE